MQSPGRQQRQGCKPVKNFIDDIKGTAFVTFGVWFPVAFFASLALISNLQGGK